MDYGLGGGVEVPASLKRVRVIEDLQGYIVHGDRLHDVTKVRVDADAEAGFGHQLLVFARPFEAEAEVQSLRERTELSHPPFSLKSRRGEIDSDAPDPDERNQERLIESSQRMNRWSLGVRR